MRTLLKIQMIGNIGNQSVIKEFNGKKYLSFNLAHNEKFKNSEGTETEKTTWVSCLVFVNDKSSLVLEKGTTIFVEGTFSVKLYDSEAKKNNIAINCNVSSFNIIGKVAKQDNT